MIVIDSDQAKSMLRVQEPVPVAMRNSRGEMFDEDGGQIDEVLAAGRWVMALGPFGSWPVSVESAEADLEKQDELYLGKSLRVGPCVIWKRGWGYAIDEATYDRLRAEEAAALIGTEVAP